MFSRFDQRFSILINELFLPKFEGTANFDGLIANLELPFDCEEFLLMLDIKAITGLDCTFGE